MCILVASATSPVLRSVSPKFDNREGVQRKLLALTVRGRGFTKDSTVYAGYGPGVAMHYAQMVLSTELVSSTELRAVVNESYQDLLDEQLWWQGDKPRMWVVGSEGRHELSDFLDVDFAEAHAMQRPQTALITSISPFPIKPMNEHSPEELRIIIRGENFLPEDKVNLDVYYFGPHEVGARTEYVSPTELRAWIPRNIWRQHQITYRLVVETTSGERYSSRVDAPDED